MPSSSKRKRKYALIPNSAERCGMCAILASRGYAYKAPFKPHNGCQCSFAMEGEKVEGYDADRYKAIYENAYAKANEGGALRKKWDALTEEEKDAWARRAKVEKGLSGDAYDNFVYHNVAEEIEEELYRNDAEYIALSHRYLNSSTDLYRFAGKVEEIEGYDDFVIHSDGIDFAYADASGKEISVSVNEFAAMIRENPLYGGGDIRLIACSSGKSVNGAAQQLSDNLGVNVLAPNMDVHIGFDGRMVLAETDDQYCRITAGEEEESGKWVLFRPRT